MISENYEISGLKSESSQEKENIFRSAVFRQKNTFFSSLFLKKAQSKSDCLYLTTNQEDVRRTLVTSDMFIVPKYRS